jgi:hypothetical protein
LAFRFPEQYRVRLGVDSSSPHKGGSFWFPSDVVGGPFPLRVMADTDDGWEHVSVSRRDRVKLCPTWEEMCFVKGAFWNPEDCVVQFHPPKNEYVNTLHHCLHLWRPAEVALPRPDPWLVGFPSIPDGAWWYRWQRFLRVGAQR